jgi:hypothetical protein
VLCPDEKQSLMLLADDLLHLKTSAFVAIFIDS